MSLAQARQQIAAGIADRIAKHQAAIASVLSKGSLGELGSPLNLLANGVSWFDWRNNKVLLFAWVLKRFLVSPQALIQEDWI